MKLRTTSNTTALVWGVLVGAACAKVESVDPAVRYGDPAGDVGEGGASTRDDDTNAVGGESGSGGTRSDGRAGGESELGGGASAGAGGEASSAPPGTCGDGIVTDDEACDDGALAAGDGCSSHCRLEVGYGCGGEPSVCEPTPCGNGVREGAETCDDGNQVPFDGCDANCQLEPRCSNEGCSSTCGDGLVLDEECDDGNTRDGDGCSSTCRVEEGSVCTPVAECDVSKATCQLRVPVVYRDFTSEHPDFDVSCLGGAYGDQPRLGLVAKPLRNGVPSLSGDLSSDSTQSACITRFSDWYSDAAKPAVVRTLTLFSDGKGAFVNRYGAEGQQWEMPRPDEVLRLCGEGDTGCVPDADGGAFIGCDFDPEVDTCLYPCPLAGASTLTCARRMEPPAPRFDGNPLFFPLDDRITNDEGSVAMLGPPYTDVWAAESFFIPKYGAVGVSSSPRHNFFFTTRLMSWFEYDASRPLRLLFAGDDDLWVFINDRLALDLGGLHNASEHELVLDATKAADLRLETGKVYRIDVFHAERKVSSSSLTVTLPAFDRSRSECHRR